jgi:DNA ligase-1
LEVSGATLMSVLRRVAKDDWSLFRKGFRDTGDIGSAVKVVFECASRNRQASLLREPLTILGLRKIFESLAGFSGSGSKVKRERLLEGLFGQASPLEAKYIVKILIGEMRTGFHEGLMQMTIGEAFGVPIDLVRRATMALGDVGEVATLAKVEGEAGLKKVRLKVFRPVELMLAQMSDGIEDVLDEHGGETAFEFKYDGARVQIHKKGKEIRIFSRRLTDVSESFPEVVALLRDQIRCNEVILEGEIVAVDSKGNPVPFQHLMRRFKRVHEVKVMIEKVPVILYLFDVLFVDGKDVINLSYNERRRILDNCVGKISLAKQVVTGDPEVADVFLKSALEAGHEGVMAKKTDSPYTPGARGKSWLKIKPVLEPLDLAITAAEYGYGRRHRWLSDYYLAVRDSESGELLKVGKTFKGLTDKEISELTLRLKGLAIEDDGHMVTVLPQAVVEVAYNEIQKSPKYKSGLALRFARIVRLRDDKGLDDVDTLQRVRSIFERQFTKKGRYKTG